MNIQFFLEKLKGSDEFKKFKKENPKSYLTSCFITVDIEGKEKNNQYHLDFFVPTTLKTKDELGTWWSFKLENGIELEQLQKMDMKDVKFEEIPDFIKNPPKITAKSTIEFDEIQRLIQEEMDKKNITNKIQKILMVLQRQTGSGEVEKYICTVFISGLGILKVIIEDANDGGGKVLFFEKKSFFDMLRKSK
ncbi:hypothetical protein COU57_04930 [Candidatus Pacearchaeota archaeon CG10_big_fil_rev_8_21_14_0_10_32_14]|nr:MAG: hypothetical protein COU57_04930 [Candidatus Pacearchaeota archaeon CG10_big_fil_rev_8_21_14_0_10_32_14]